MSEMVFGLCESLLDQGRDLLEYEGFTFNFLYHF